MDLALLCEGTESACEIGAGVLLDRVCVLVLFCRVIHSCHVYDTFTLRTVIHFGSVCRLFC